MTSPKHLHLIGISGTAMASLAGMLLERGFRVTGSDRAAYPPMSDFLRGLGIAVSEPFAAGNLTPTPDLVVVGNAISRGNVELEHALDRRIPLSSMPQLLHDEFLRGKEVVLVAGTHGKTTTTSMLAWIFECAGTSPSVLIGGIAENFGRSFQLGGGRYFILEGDEYDTAFFDKGPKFMHYFPDAVILTSVEFDHADIYKDLDAVETAFERLVNLVPARGRILALDSTDGVERAVAQAFCPVERYGSSERSDWRIRDLEFGEERTRWSVAHKGKTWSRFEFSLAGEYNVRNATAAAALAASYGIPPPVVADALRTFKSVKRRLEVKAEIRGITVIDDFAHHPTAVRATLEALRTRYRARRLWAILEPRSNTLRRNVFEDDLAESLALADEILIAGVFESDRIPEGERLDVSRVARKIERQGRHARVMADVAAIVGVAVAEMRPGDVVAILSNGGFDGIYEALPAGLRAAEKSNAPEAPRT